MTQPRNRKKPELSFQERLKRFADEARQAAMSLPAGKERDSLGHKAKQNEIAANIDLWLTSPGLRSPK